MVRMVTVHAGPLWEMQLLQGWIEEQGIPSYISSRIAKQAYPFATGAGALTFELQVPASLAKRVSKRLAAYREAATERNRRRAATADPAVARWFALERLGTRARWAACTAVLAPVAVVLGLLYTIRTYRSGIRPTGHLLTMTAVLWAVVTMGAAVLLLL